MANDLMYPGWPPMQQQGMYGMNTGQRVVDHGGYPINHGMMSQQQQMGFRTTPQSAMANQGRMPFAGSFNPNAVNVNPQMISNMNSYTGINQYPTGMMNRAQQQLVRMSPYSGGARVVFPSTGANSRPVRPLVDSGRRPNTGGGYNPAMIVAHKPGSIIPYKSPNNNTTSWPMLSSVSNDSSYNYQFAPLQQTRFDDPSLPGPSSRWTADSMPSPARSKVIIMMLNAM